MIDMMRFYLLLGIAGTRWLF